MKWFDDWNIQTRPYIGKRESIIFKAFSSRGKSVYKYISPQTQMRLGRFEIKLPNADKPVHLIFTAKNKRENTHLYALFAVLNCALYELTKQRKHWWEFWK